jgi:hypothetical protein
MHDISVDPHGMSRISRTAVDHDSRFPLRTGESVAATSGVVSGFFGGSGTSAVMIFSLP